VIWRINKLTFGFLLFISAPAGADEECGVLDFLNQYRGMFSIYNCSVEIDVQKPEPSCEENCESHGTVYLRDHTSGGEVLIPLLFDRCGLSAGIKSNSTKIELLRETHGMSWWNRDYLGIWIDANKRLLRIEGRTEQTTSNGLKAQVAACAGVNPVRRQWDDGR
jgi:hypothetical protein